jgi:hypothetical protein
MAVHGRHALAELALRAAAASSPPGWEIRPVVVMSLDDAPAFAPFCDAAGIPWVAADNDPLSFKWQRGLEFLRGVLPGAEAVTILGSDDFCSPAWWQYVCRMIHSGEEQGFGTHKVWMLDSDTLQSGLFVCQSTTSMGAGRTFPRHHLERADWVLWDAPINKGLDNHCGSRLARLDLPIRTVRGAPGIIIDVKTSENIHSWQEFATWCGLPLSKFEIVLDPKGSRDLLEQHELFTHMEPLFAKHMAEAS